MLKGGLTQVVHQRIFLKSEWNTESYWEETKHLGLSCITKEETWQVIYTLIVNIKAKCSESLLPNKLWSLHKEKQMNKNSIL